MKIKFLYLLLLSLCLTKICYAEEISVDARFKANQISVGQESKFYITVHGTQKKPNVALPTIPGLTFLFDGSRHNIQVVNGSISNYGIHTYTIRAQKPGKYGIPEIDVTISGKTYKTKPLSLEVLDNGEFAVDGEHSPVKMELSIPKGIVYVGQMVPLDIKLLLPMGMGGKVLSVPIGQDDAFIDYQFPEHPTQGTTTIDGKEYQLVTWKTYITPLKSGTQKLEYKLALELSRPGVREDSPLRALLGRGFDLSLDDFLGNHTERFDLFSKPYKINVLPLPPHGAPENFTGAVGKFILGKTELDHEVSHIGEPITLKVPVVGFGNFSRITPTPLPTQKAWKTYDPKSTFKQKDKFGFEGGKYLEYIIIPQETSITQTPKIQFSYFDPETGQYEELDSPSIAINIKPSEHPETAESPLIANTTSSTPKQAIRRKSELEPIMLKMTHTRKTLSPKFLSAPIIGTNAFLVSAISGLIFIKKRRKRFAEDKPYATRKISDKALNKHLHKLRHSYSKKDIPSFYNAAQHAITESIVHNHKQAESLTIEELNDILMERDLPKRFIEPIQTIFESANVAKFSGKEGTEFITKEELRKVENLIEELGQCTSK